jgi:hypothetical protein
MADALTHMAVAAIPGMGVRDPASRWMLYGGALLPDVIDKALRFILLVHRDFAVASHTLLGIGLISAAAALTFPQQARFRMFCCLLAGGCTHLLADLFQSAPPGFGVYPLLPFWTASWTVGLYLGTDHVYMIPLSLVFLIVMEWKWHRCNLFSRIGDTA